MERYHLHGGEVDALDLSIKNEEAHRLAQELAALTGESMAVAVTEALRERQRTNHRACEHHVEAPGRRPREGAASPEPEHARIARYPCRVSRPAGCA